MELVREFDNRHALLVLLRLGQAWPPDLELPEGFFVDPADRGLLSTNRDSLVASVSVLPSTTFSAALFAGCAGFRFSDDAFGVAASQLLRTADMIFVVHNTDLVHGLLRLFPNAMVLVLVHDIAGEHDAEAARPDWAETQPREQSSYQLRMLVRTTGAEEMGDFAAMSRETVVSVLRACPQIPRLESFVSVAFAMLPNKNSCSTEKPNSRNFRHLTFDTDVLATLQGAFFTPATRQLPLVEHLEVTLSSLEDFIALRTFVNLRSLSVTFSVTDLGVNVGHDLERLLQRWPRLETLSLAMCAGVRLSAIAGCCPRLGELRLVDCSGFHAHNDELVEEGFSHLRHVELTRTALAAGVVVLLAAVRQQMRSLRLGDDRVCSTFLNICCTSSLSATVVFPLLEDLTLRTDYTVRAFGLEPEHLHRAVRAMPALRHLETDSYDLRLFFENYSVPRGCVSLSWCDCAYCGVHCPKLCSSSGFEEDDDDEEEETTTSVGGINSLSLSGRGDEGSDAADPGKHSSYECDDQKFMTEEDERARLLFGGGDTYPTSGHSASDRSDKSVSEDVFKHVTSGRGEDQSTGVQTTTASDEERFKAPENASR